MLQPEFRKPPEPQRSIEGSPMSKRILREYSNSSAKPRELDTPEKENPIHQPEPINVPDTQESEEGTITDLFRGLNFLCHNLDSAIEAEVMEDVIRAGGKIVPPRFAGVLDYTVTSVLTTELQTTTCEVVTHLWIVSFGFHLRYITGSIVLEKWGECRQKFYPANARVKSKTAESIVSNF